MFIDIIFIVVAITGFFTGYQKGLISSLINIVAILVAFLAAAKFSPWLIDIFKNILPDIDPRFYLILGFIVCFIVFMAGIKWLGRNLEQGLRGAHLNFINKLSGGALFLLLNTVILSTILWVLKDFNLLSPERFSSSVTYPTLQQIPLILGEILESIKPVFQDFWEKVTEATKSLKEGME